MSNPGDADATQITSLKQLADHIAAGCKPPERFRIGTEHEKFGFRLADLAPPPYEPADGQPGSIRDLLAGLTRFGGTPIADRGNTIGLKQGDAAISLEPAGQLELSGAPLETLHDDDGGARGALRPGAQRFARPSDRLGAARLPPDRDARTDAAGCRRAATTSCGATCRRSARSAST